MAADESVEGLILRIERSSIHDGRGLRTVIFFKGCPLSCTWCSTPESQRTVVEQGYIADRCLGCGECVESCSSGALALHGRKVTTDYSRCSHCFDCVACCPQDARRVYGRTMTTAQVIAEICKDEIFFFHSGGGVTLSGGECLLQPDFVAAVLKGCRQRGIDTAIETSLFAPWSIIETLLPFVNTIYVDLKHPHPGEHRKSTGVDNTLILENMRKLDQSEQAFSFYLRLPLIPGINDSDECLRATLAIAAGLTRLKGIEILPYHRLGLATYGHLDRHCMLEDVPTPTAEYIIERTGFLRNLQPQVPVKIGGGYI